jgi:hypothetical protein
MRFFRKIVIGVTSIVFTAAALTSTTYAWFKINSRASVTGINFKVTSGDGFKVSVDDVSYTSDITAEQIYNAMIVKYAPDRFIIHYDEATRKSALYTTKQVNVLDDNGEPVMIPDGNGGQIPKMELTYDQPASESDIQAALKSIQLMPVTTEDGVHMHDLYSATATATSGRYIEFDIWFKTINETGYRTPKSFEEDRVYYEYKNGEYVENNYAVTSFNYQNYFIYCGEESKYDIYLNGDDGYEDPMTHRISKLSPSSFTSGLEKVRLSADMTAVINGEVTNIPHTSNSTVDVYGANALRLSITDTSRYEAGTGEGVLVYELNDAEHASANLGSYATNYSEEYCTTNHIAHDLNEEKLYGYKYSASYTYFSNLKRQSLESSLLYDKLLDYKDSNSIYKKTIKAEDLKKDSNGNYSNNKIITTLSTHAKSSTKLTFRIWLEGWDADCFDGIAGSIQSILSFVSVRKDS